MRRAVTLVKGGPGPTQGLSRTAGLVAHCTGVGVIGPGLHEARSRDIGGVEVARAEGLARLAQGLSPL
jgi:hypothetical protein